MCENWSVHCALADLGMEERVKGGWYLCVLRASQVSTQLTLMRSFPSLLLSRLHGVEPDRATWQAAHRAFMQAFVLPPDTVKQKKLAKILKRLGEDGGKG